MVLVFPYKKEKGGVFRPKIPVLLSNKNKKLKVFAIIDSGSDKNYIPYGIATHLRIPLRGHKYEIGTAGGTRKVTDGKCKLTIGMGDEQYSFRATVQVPILEDRQADVLLGRDGFFDKFIVTFNEKEKTVELERLG